MKRTEQINTIYIGYDPKEDAAYEVLRDTIKANSPKPIIIKPLIKKELERATLLYRPFELIRNYLNHEEIPVKLVGGGRDKDYGYLGFSHWAEDDTIVMSCFNNIITHHPRNIKELEELFDFFINDPTPQYLNLRR